MDFPDSLREMLENLGNTISSASTGIKKIRKDFTPEDLETVKSFLDDFKELANKYLLIVKDSNRLPLADLFTDIMVDSMEAVQNALQSHNNRFICNAVIRKIVNDTGSHSYINDFTKIPQEMRAIYNAISEEAKMNTIEVAPIEEELTAEDMMKSQNKKHADFLGMTSEELADELKKSTPSAEDIMTETGDGDKPE